MEINPLKFQNNFEHFSLNKNEEENKTQAFSDLFREKINEVNQLENASDNITADFAAGRTDNIHDVTIAAEKARVAVNLTTAVQNKVIDAYNEIMRLQV